MPNYVKNRVELCGAREKLRELLNGVAGENGCFDFNRLISMPQTLNIENGSRTDDGVEMYLSAINPSLPKRMDVPKMRKEGFEKFMALLRTQNPFHIYSGEWGQKEMDDHCANTSPEEIIRLGQAAIANFMQYHALTWYEWCPANWGTKWNACDPSIKNNPAASAQCPDSAAICFETAWSCPEPIIYKLAEKYPDVAFTWKYADEESGSNAGEYFHEQGETLEGGAFDGESNAAYQTYIDCWGESPCLEQIEGEWRRYSCEDCPHPCA